MDDNYSAQSYNSRSNVRFAFKIYGDTAKKSVTKD